MLLHHRCDDYGNGDITCKPELLRVLALHIECATRLRTPGLGVRWHTLYPTVTSFCNG
jgi:hypothetical protein